MTKYYVRWQMNYQLTPVNPEDRIILLLSLQEMVKEDIQAGNIKDWGVAAGETCGYAIVEQSSEADLHADLHKWVPYVSFKVNPVLTFEQVAEVTQKALASAKAK